MAINRRQFLGSLGGVAAGLTIGDPFAESAQGVQQLSALTQKGGAGPPAEVALSMYQERSGVKIVMTPVPWEAQFEKTMVEFIGKSTSFDILSANHGWSGAMYRFFEDLEPYVRKYNVDGKPFPKNAWEAGKWKGRRIGLPFRLGVGALFYYRKDLYEKMKLSVPNTMEELVKNAEALTSPKDNIYGFGSQLGGDPNSFLDLQSWHLPFGGRILKDPDQEELAPFEPHGELMIKILKAWKQMLDKGWMSQGVLTWGILDVLTAFQQGLIAQAMMFSPRVTLVEDPTKSKVAGKAGYALLFPKVPAKDSIGPRGDKGDGWNFGINQWISDERKDAAFKAVQFMVSREAQLAAALKAANGPSRIDVLEDPQFQKIYPAWKPLREGLETFHSGVSVPEQPKISKVVSDRIANVLLGREKPEDAVRAAWKEMDGIMKEAKKG